MSSFSSLRARLIGTVFLAVAPAWLAIYYIAKKTGTEHDLVWLYLSGGIGFLALAAAWFGGERFVLRQVRLLKRAAQAFEAGNYESRTGLAGEGGELGELAQSLDSMAASLQERAKERERGEEALLTRSLQQTVVSALGQFALTSSDFPSLCDQAVMMVSQTLGVEYCSVLELQPGGMALTLRAGIGWKPEAVGKLSFSALPHTQSGYTLTAGEPVVVEDTSTEQRFKASPLETEHGIVSAITVSIGGAGGRAFGVLGAHTGRRRQFSEDETYFLLSVATVLAMAVARRRTEAEVRKLAAFAQLNPKPAMELAASGALTYHNEAAIALAQSLGREHPGEILPSNIDSLVKTCLATHQQQITLETQMEGRTLSWSLNPVPASRVVHAYVEEISERLSLEAQLRQSQKMESIGQLAAGVAHDFNNMLTIIQGHAGMLLAKSGGRTELFDSCQAIYFAAERAANLTRQLLMFSRKNVMQPRLVDLRQVVGHMSKMLQRLLGEPITLQFDPPPQLPMVHADVGMLEQVIMNLAVNARDAMPEGGTLTISTAAVDFEDIQTQSHPEARPGSFVCLRVKDTGIGMDSATQARIFEPFFTTKEVGKGTGLGLATVYGIVKQHDGWIQVTSEPGRGATFSVFIPACSPAKPAQAAEPAPTSAVRGGKETILVVEDEPVLRDMAHVMLEDCGYDILEARSGREALDIWEKHQDQIDLVLTDMVMPEGVSGMELAQQLLARKPTLKIIFASGYSMDDIDPAFVRDGHAVFLQKPYTHVTLAKAVRDCLDKK